MSKSPDNEAWRKMYADLIQDADEIFANGAITSVARQRLSNHGGYSPDKIRKNAMRVFDLRAARRAARTLNGKKSRV